MLLILFQINSSCWSLAFFQGVWSNSCRRRSTSAWCAATSSVWWRPCGAATVASTSSTSTASRNGPARPPPRQTVRLHRQLHKRTALCFRLTCTCLFGLRWESFLFHLFYLNHHNSNKKTAPLKCAALLFFFFFFSPLPPSLLLCCCIYLLQIQLTVGVVPPARMLHLNTQPPTLASAVSLWSFKVAITRKVCHTAKAFSADRQSDQSWMAAQRNPPQLRRHVWQEEEQRGLQPPL